MKTLALSGWAQPPDALRAIAPEAMHLPYAEKPDAERALAVIAAAKPELVIGWSMGGQMAVRAIAERRIAPRFLVLIGTPFRFMGGAQVTYRQFHENMRRNPTRTLRKSYALIAHGDANAGAVSTRLTEMQARLPEYDWVYWLEALAGQNFSSADFTHFPPTLLIHGENDAVIAPEQARLFHARLPKARLEMLTGCGHAPHWHKPDWVKEAITRHVQR